MNSQQTSRVLKKMNINGFNNVAWEFRAPEVIGNDQIFSNDLITCNITNADYENNIALFVLFRNYGSFKSRMTGKICDSWISKSNFETIAQECYDILEAQSDLEDWQTELKENFKSMV
jgi:hypothetical protein